MSIQIIMKGKAKIPVGTMEDFRRPDHNDFATTTELKDRQFTGVRHNAIAQTVEVWTLGDIRGSVPERDQAALAKLMQDTFGIDRVLVDKG